MSPIAAIFAFLGLVLYFILALLVSALFFPLPVADAGTVRYRSIPYITLLLIFINAGLYFMWQLPAVFSDVPYDYYRTIYTYGFRSTTIWRGHGIGAFTTFTSIFMHGSDMHLIGNMFFLWTYGRRVEDACGHWRYLLFYLFSGMVANLGSALLNPAGGDIPGIGASGAISGVMGAFLILFPSARISCLWILGSMVRMVPAALGFLGQPLKVWKWTVQVPAWTLLLYFAVRNFFPSLEVIQQGNSGGGVNTIAHLIGFLGAVAIVFFVRKDLLVRIFTGRSS
jgi:membrane associated rhomboid family serine protease